METFKQLSENLQNSLTKLGITEPTPVQTEIIPRIIGGENVLFQSETGTGKTFAYLLPLINKLESLTDNQRVRIIVIAPTFELASQINTACKSITTHKSALLIGGAPLKRQMEVLKEKPEIIIGTAARLVELIHLKKLKVDGVFAVVFDETDRLVKKEALDDTSALRNLMPAGTQIIACTATLNKPTKIFFADASAKFFADADKPYYALQQLSIQSAAAPAPPQERKLCAMIPAFSRQEPLSIAASTVWRMAAGVLSFR